MRGAPSEEGAAPAEMAMLEAPPGCERPPSSRGRARWDMVAHKCSLLLRTSVSVADENKVGIAPEGSLRRVVELLHPALGPALRGASPTSPRHPVTLIKPSLFAEIRAVLHIPDAAFHASMALQQGRFQSDMRTIPVAQAAGKSRAFFFLSPDQHYIFKSAGNADLETLYRIAPQYIEHFKTHANSLLPRYVAVIELRMEEGEPVHFIVMCNALGGVRPIHKRYDMKGSTYNRVASKKELSKEHPVFKDQDWLREGRRLYFPEDDVVGKGQSAGTSTLSRSAFIEVLQKDTAFLARMRLIDYSILVGVHEFRDSSLPHRLEQTPGLVAIATSDAVCYICLIDILTSYGYRKCLETFCMSTIFCCRDISCQPPRVYSRRFMRFIDIISAVRKRRHVPGSPDIIRTSSTERLRRDASTVLDGAVRMDEVSC